jgi:DNA-directed RNA polymerase specialized sigma subunit
MTNKEKIEICEDIIRDIEGAVDRYYICNNYPYKNIEDVREIVKELEIFGKEYIRIFDRWHSSGAFQYGSGSPSDYNASKINHIKKYIEHLRNEE